MNGAVIMGQRSYAYNMEDFAQILCWRALDDGYESYCFLPVVYSEFPIQNSFEIEISDYLKMLMNLGVIFGKLHFLSLPRAVF